MSVRVVTGPVRLSFPNLFEPRARKEGAPKKYSVLLLIPKSDKETLKKLKAAEAAAAEEGKNTKFGGRIPKFESIIHDGDESDLEIYPEQAGHYIMNVSSSEQYRPGIIDKNRNKVLDQSEVYPGVYARVSLDAYAYASPEKKGVTFGLGNVQVLGYGESLSGAIKAEDEFDEFEVEEESLI